MLVVPLVPEVVWRGGLLGYNAVLCATYWSGSREQPLLRAVIAVVLSVALELLALAEVEGIALRPGCLDSLASD